MASTAIRRPRIKDLHSHLVCGICMGYFVDATTINECLHTFCRSCIVKYLDTSNFCPMCDVQIHKSRPLQNLRPDKMLQDLVYKVVPGFYATEMQKRRDCYSSTKAKAPVTPSIENLTTAEMKGEPEEPRHYSPDESISLSLEYYIENDNANDEDEEGEEEVEIADSSENDEKKNPTRRYYKCPAAVCIRILKKLLRSKYGLHENEKVDIIFKKECLPEHFTLIDVGYIFSCKKKGLLKFYFRFYTRPHSNNAVSTKSIKRSLTDTTNGELKRSRVNTIESGTTTENSSTTENNSRKNERFPTIPLTTTTHNTSLSNEEPEKKSVTSKAIPSAPRLPSPKRTQEKSDEKAKRPMAQVDSGIPTKKTKQDPPKIVQKPETPPVPIPKPVATQPPKPIQPGLKPPSQTSLLLKQQIAQQREQQKQQQQQQQLLKMQRQMLSQKQAKLGMTRVDNKSPMPSKQIPQLQKLNQKQVVKNNGRPVMPQPTTHSIGTQSLPIISKAQDPSPKQTALPPKTASMGVNTKVTQSQIQAQRPPTSNASVSVSVSTTPTMSKAPSTPSPNLNSNLPPMNSADQRRLTNDMIEKNKLRPVVVIERHGNGRPKVKQVPSPLKLHHLSREFNKMVAEQSPSTLKTTTSATTLAVSPTDSATKVKIIKTATNSSETNDQTKTSEASKLSSGASSSADGETPKGKGPQAAGALDLSGKSTRKSDSPNSSVGSPSPPAPKVPSPVQAVEQRKTPPAAALVKITAPAPQTLPQKQVANSKAKPNNNKVHDIMKIAQNCLNEKLPFFRQSQQFPSMPNMQVQQIPPNPAQMVAPNKLNSFTYLWNEAMMRSTLNNVPKPKEPQQKSMTPQPRGRPPNSQGPRQVIGPRATMPTGQNKSMSPNMVPIRIPNPTKTSPPRHMETTMTPSRVQPRIHDLFPNPQQSKPGPNQAVRHIPNPSLLGRQNAMRMQHIDISPASVRKDEITITPARNPALPSPSSSLRKIETLTQNLQRSICEGKLTAPPSMSIGVVASEASQ